MLTEKQKTYQTVSLLCLIVAGFILLLSLSAVYGQEKPRAGIEESSDKEAEGKLGELLFSDPILSANGKVSCATCHLKDKGFTSSGLAPMYEGGLLSRRAPSLLNVSTARSYFWDGRAETLEDQAAAVLTNPKEMGKQTLDDITKRVAAKYPKIKTSEQLIKALTDYERTLTHSDRRFEKHLQGGPNVLTSAERRGWDLFRGKAQCYRCHKGNETSDGSFHNTGIGLIQTEGPSREHPRGIWTTKDHEENGFGRYSVTKDLRDWGSYKTPALRDCRNSSPYMHDASLKTLDDVVEFYDRGGIQNPNLDKLLLPLRLNRQEKADLVAFLRVL